MERYSRADPREVKKVLSNALNNGQRRQLNSDELRNVIRPQMWLPYWTSLPVGEKKVPSLSSQSSLMLLFVAMNPT